MSPARASVLGLLGFALVGGWSAAHASYGQMRIDLTPIIMAAGLMAGALIGGAEILCARARLLRGWTRFALVAGGLLLMALLLVALVVRSDIRLLIGLVVYVELLVWAPVLSRLVPLRAWQRGLILGGAALWALKRASTSPPYQGEFEWFVGAALAAWAALSSFAGDGAAGAGHREPGPERHWARSRAGERVLMLMRGLLEAWGAVGARVVQLARRGTAGTGLLSRATLVFVLLYALGAAIVFTNIPVLSGVLLGMAGALPGAGQAPVDGGPESLAYWMTFGLLPSLLVAAATAPFCRVAPRD